MARCQGGFRQLQLTKPESPIWVTSSYGVPRQVSPAAPAGISAARCPRPAVRVMPVDLRQRLLSDAVAKMGSVGAIAQCARVLRKADIRGFAFGLVSLRAMPMVSGCRMV